MFRGNISIMKIKSKRIRSLLSSLNSHDDSMQGTLPLHHGKTLVQLFNARWKGTRTRDTLSWMEMGTVETPNSYLARLNRKGKNAILE